MAQQIRHLEEIMRKAGADMTPENRQMLDKAVREVLGMQRADSSDVNKKVKSIIQGDPETRKEFEKRVTGLLVKYLITG